MTSDFILLNGYILIITTVSVYNYTLEQFDYHRNVLSKSEKLTEHQKGQEKLFYVPRLQREDQKKSKNENRKTKKYNQLENRKTKKFLETTNQLDSFPRGMFCDSMEGHVLALVCRLLLLILL